jgi:hypothetical protein
VRPPHVRPLAWRERHEQAASLLAGLVGGTVGCLTMIGLIYIVSLVMEVIWS